MEKTFKTLSMCDFCTREREACGAEPILSRAVAPANGSRLDSEEAVVACDRYESPVDSLKKQFH